MTKITRTPCSNDFFLDFGLWRTKGISTYFYDITSIINHKKGQTQHCTFLQISFPKFGRNIGQKPQTKISRTPRPSVFSLNSTLEDKKSYLLLSYQYVLYTKMALLCTTTFVKNVFSKFGKTRFILVYQGHRQIFQLCFRGVLVHVIYG